MIEARRQARAGREAAKEAAFRQMLAGLDGTELDHLVLDETVWEFDINLDDGDGTDAEPTT